VFFIQKDWRTGVASTKSMPSSLPRLPRCMSPRCCSPGRIAISRLAGTPPTLIVKWSKTDLSRPGTWAVLPCPQPVAKAPSASSTAPRGAHETRFAFFIR